MKKKDKILNLIAPLISILCIVILWVTLALLVDNQYLMPDFFSTVRECFRLFTIGEFYYALFGTLLRSIIAFLVAFILAVILAVLTFKLPKLSKYIAPIISIIRVLPTIAIVLIVLVWTSSFIAPIIVTFLVVFPTLYLNVKNALDGVEKDQLEMLKVFNVDKKVALKKVVFPQIAPPILLAMGAGLALNLKLMVAAEVLSYTVNSIGNLLQLSKVYDQMVTMMALVLVTVIIGLLIEGLFSYFSKKVGKWQ